MCHQSIQRCVNGHHQHYFFNKMIVLRLNPYPAPPHLILKLSLSTQSMRFVLL